MSEDPRYTQFRARGGTLSYAVWLQMQSFMGSTSAPKPPAPAPTPARAIATTAAPQAPIMSTPREVQEFQAKQSEELRKLNADFEELDRAAGVDAKTAPKPKRGARARASYPAEVSAQYFVDSEAFTPLSYKMAVALGSSLGGLVEIDPSLSGIEIAGGVIRYALAQAGVSTQDAQKIRQLMASNNVLGYNFESSKEAERLVAQRLFTKVTGLSLPLQPTALPGTPEAEAVRALLRQIS